MKISLPLCVLSAVFFSCITHVNSQNALNWSSDFTPVWRDGDVSGTAASMSGTGISCTTNCSISSGIFTLAMGNAGPKTPTVGSAMLSVPNSPTRLQVAQDLTRSFGYSDINMSFSALILNASFLISDIDKSSPVSTSQLDKVIITGSDGVNTYQPVISRYESSDPDFLVISGNSASVNPTPGMAGDAVSDGNDQRGTIVVSFGNTPISSISIRYQNANGVNTDPAVQSIAIGSVSFSFGTLPVRLQNFSGRKTAGGNTLSWTTSNEQQLSGFELERNDNGNWHSLTAVAAKNNDLTNQYQYTDAYPAAGQNLYRLRIKDQDGRSSYSAIVRMNSDAGAVVSLRSYPNPASAQLQVSIDWPQTGNARVNLVDMAGKTVMSATRNLSNGSNAFTLDGLSNYSRGQYYLVISDASGQYRASQPVVLQ